MSILRPEILPCPICAEPTEFEVAHSVNADRRPDLRDSIVDRSFQCATCPTCGTVFRRPPSLTYMDIGNKLWIIAAPAGKLAEWGALEAQTNATFQRSYGPAASAMAQDFARGLSVRLVFGWAALREKIVLAVAGLDDITMEMLKLSIIRSEGGDLLSDTTELRLIAVEADTLKLASIDTRTDKLEELIELPRGAYDNIASDEPAWASVRAELTAGPFVDLSRMLMSPVPA